ncbi:MAG TPA: LytR C-terminal domain-containing protein [Gaiellales bacterium]|jgi:hypothetical protein
MAPLETRDRPSGPVEDTGEEHLDDWFARRLQSQGIPSRLGGTPTPRLLAVGGLVLALVAFLWALSSVGAHTGSTGATAPTTPKTTVAPPANNQGTGSTKKHNGKLTWRDVTVDVVNGFGGPSAAAQAASQLSQKGWSVGVTGNATGIASTEIVYLPGNLKAARVVARKLGLGTPVAIAQATGVAADATHGVAVVLGPDELTNATL